MGDQLYYYTGREIEGSYSVIKQPILFMKHFLFDEVGIKEFIIVSRDEGFPPIYNTDPGMVIEFYYAGRTITEDEELTLNINCAQNGFMINKFNQISDTDMLLMKLENDL